LLEGKRNMLVAKIMGILTFSGFIELTIMRHGEVLSSASMMRTIHH